VTVRNPEFWWSNELFYRLRTPWFERVKIIEFDFLKLDVDRHRLLQLVREFHEIEEVTIWSGDFSLVQLQELKKDMPGVRISIQNKSALESPLASNPDPWITWLTPQTSPAVE
jgi:hypothetical protein